MGVRDIIQVLNRSRLSRATRQPVWLTRRFMLGSSATLLVFIYLLRQAFQPPPKTLVIPLSGRLGNQLFQLAAGAAVQRRSGGARIAWLENLYSSETDFRATLFKDANMHSTEESACGGPAANVHLGLRRNCGDLFDAMESVRQHRCSVLKAYFQCHWLAERGRHAVIYALRAQAEAWGESAKIEKELRVDTPKDVPLVAVHVRRGDYTKKFNKALLEPVAFSYYTDAMSRFPGAHFIVFSDDLKWCRGAFSELKARGVRITFLRVEDAIVAMLAMARMDHHIIANSTFSWWAAFLRDAFADQVGDAHTVIAPAQWYGTRVSEAIAILPDHWVRLNMSDEGV